MKVVVLISLLFIVNQLSGQFILKGSITDQNQSAIPGARVSIDQTTYGVITNFKGEYFLELKAKGNYKVAISMVGMKDTSITINVSEKTTSLNISMRNYTEQLETIEVSSKKIDVAKKVIKSMQSRRHDLANQFDNYQSNTYLKTGLEKSMDPKFAEKSKSIDSIISAGPARMNFIESYAITKHKSPNTYYEEVIAHHDYAEKARNNVSANISFDMGMSIAPVQYIETNPYIFFEKIQDGDFNLYQNMINAPKISEHPIVSPIAFNAFLNYNFDLGDIFYEGNQKVYEIKVTPKFKQAALFEGTLFILDKIWVIKSFELSINKAATPFFDNFTIHQDYELIDSFWVPTRREFIYTIKEGRYFISGNTRVNQSNYKFNQSFDPKTFNDQVLSFKDDAFDKDSSFWEATRPIQLKSNELKFIYDQDSIDTYLKSEAYLDSMDAQYNKITIWDVTLSGIGFRNRFKKQNIYINSLLNSAKIFGVGGFRFGLGGSYSKKFENAHKIKFSGDFDYGFKNTDLKGSGGIDYTFLPKQFGKIEINAGDIYDLITDYNSVLGTFSRGNYVRKRFFEITQRIEIFNGLYGKASLSYSDRENITNLELSNWSDQLFGTLNVPQDFERYKIAMIELQLLYRFKQKYIIKQNEKQIIGTKYPEIAFTYKKGIPNLFDSEVNFDFIEFKVSDEIALGNYGDAKWSALAGSFVNDASLRFIEHKFFRGSDRFFFSNPLLSHQMLDSTFNTRNPYFQGFFLHHFNGFIMNKIPLINRLKLELSAGGSALIIQDISYSHAEVFAGIEKKFRIKQQYFRVGAYVATRANTTTELTYQFKIGIDFFNSFTNSWTY
ncbi:MAG: DUF5686 and carboxypeptidase regulatory-like domain-containing protein [Crocinitomicaceae bacterium]